jgi:carbon-monoxide dehydrogenase small subunit
MISHVHLAVTVNGQSVSVAVAPRLTLADLLRDALRLTGTRIGCEQGVCGACTVLLDGVPVRSCLVLAAQVDGRSVETIEGIVDDPIGAKVVREFECRRAYQCGFCTAGFEVLGTWLARTESNVDEKRATEVAATNLCRCTGYAPIIEALKAGTET